MLLLCSGLTLKNVDTELRPFTLSQWNKLSDKLIEKNYTPKDLFKIKEIQSDLRLDEADLERIILLLSREGQLSLAISQLNALGINILTRADKNYPKIYKSKLKKNSPTILYYAGNMDLFSMANVAVVGSRNVDEDGINFTEKFVKKACEENYNIVSGGARGVDTIAENTALENNGNVIIFVSESLSKKVKNKNIRNAIFSNRCITVSSVHPDEHFKNYNAMDRNKYIYAASQYSLVVSSDYKKGGTWTGAIECYKKDYSKLIIRNSNNNLPIGNKKLLELPNVKSIMIEQLDKQHLSEMLKSNTNNQNVSIQMNLFS